MRVPDLRREDVLRGAVRAVIAATILGLLSSLLRFEAPAVPAPSALYVGLLALPATLFEADACRRLPRPRWWAVAAVGWVGALSAVVLAHVQAVHADGVLTTGTLTGGAAALEFEWARLKRYEPEIGLRLLIFEAGDLAGLAAAVATGALARPLAGTLPGTSRLTLPALWLVVAVGAVLAGSLAVSVLELELLPALPIVIVYLAVASAPALLAFSTAWAVSELLLPVRA